MPAMTMYVTIKSKPHLTKQRFHDHWRHPHGTWGRGIAGITSYIQNHRIDTPHIGPGQETIDGVVEVGLGNPEDIFGPMQDKVYIEHLQPDEPNFVENTGLGFLADDLLHAGPEFDAQGRWGWRLAEQAISIKLIQVATGSAAIGSEDDDTAAKIGAVRHVRALQAGVSLDAATINGIRQLWWPTLTAFEQGIAQSATAWRYLTAPREGLYTGLFQSERFI